MYQNVTLLPLASLTGKITHISVIIYDVTDIAVNKLQLKAANEQLERLSQTDGLTQLHNRRHWQQCLEHEFDLHARYSGMSSLVMIDIDHFKRINDTYGHVAGDKVIQHIAHILSHSLRRPIVSAAMVVRSLQWSCPILVAPMPSTLPSVCGKELPTPP